MASQANSGEFESVDCTECGETEQVHARHMGHVDPATFTCESCHDVEMVDRLVEAFQNGGDSVFSRAQAARHLRQETPLQLDEETVLLEVEVDIFEGRSFISKERKYASREEPCEECGMTEVRTRWTDNGIIAGYHEDCACCGETRESELYD